MDSAAAAGIEFTNFTQVHLCEAVASIQLFDFQTITKPASFG